MVKLLNELQRLVVLMDSTIIGFIGVVIGAVLTCGVSIYLDNKKEEREIKATIKALKAELQTVEHIFITEFGAKITTKEEHLVYSYPLDTDYFTIFQSNATKIGKINNDKLRESIIFIYSTCKFFIDCLKTNNVILEDYSKTKEKYCHLSDTDKMYNERYKKDMDSICYRLQKSKTENLLPTYNKLKALFDNFKTID